MTCDQAEVSNMEAAVLKELKRLHEEGFSAKAINNLKVNLASDLKNALASNEGWLTMLTLDTLWGRNLEEHEEQCKKEIQKLDNDALKAMTRRLFPLDNYTMVTLLPKKT